MLKKSKVCTDMLIENLRTGRTFTHHPHSRVRSVLFLSLTQTIHSHENSRMVETRSPPKSYVVVSMHLQEFATHNIESVMFLVNYTFLKFFIGSSLFCIKSRSLLDNPKNKN